MIQGISRPRASIFLVPCLLLIVFQDPGATAERLRRGVELLEARAQVLEFEIQILENTGLSFPTEHLKEAL